MFYPWLTIGLLATRLKSKKSHNFFNIYRNFMRIFLFERSYKYLPILKLSKLKILIKAIGTYPKTPKTYFGPHGSLGVKLKVIIKLYRAKLNIRYILS